MGLSTAGPIDLLVVHPASPGIAHLSGLAGDEVRLDLFEAAAEPVAESQWVLHSDLRRVPLSPQPQVSFKDGWHRWRAGRVLDGGPDVYRVRLPNSDVDLQVPADRLRVRWERPPQDRLQVLPTGINETPPFHDARAPVRRLLLAERAATSSATGIVSAGVRLHPHQISAAPRPPETRRSSMCWPTRSGWARHSGLAS